MELEYYSKQNKLVREKQIPYDLIHMWNLRDKTKEQRWRGENPRDRLLTIGNKLVVTKREGTQWMGEICDGD